MDDREKMRLLVEMRKKFREGRPDLDLPPAGKEDLDEERRRQEERRLLAKEKRTALEHTAKTHPETIARMIRKYTESK